MDTRYRDDDEEAHPLVTNTSTSHIAKLKPQSLWTRRRALMASGLSAAVCALWFAASRTLALLSNQCSRVVIHQFDSSSGFGSEFSILLRMTALASHFGAPVISNSTGWIYGDLSHYFLPPTLPSSYPYTCILPADVAHIPLYTAPDPHAASPKHTTFSVQSWKSASRLDVTRSPWNQFPLQDRLVREAHFKMDEIAALKAKEHWFSVDYTRFTLPYGQSVQSEMYNAFLAQMAVMNQYWRPTPATQAQIDRLARRVELAPETYRSTTVRRPVVVVQIRLGDKWQEQDDILAAGSHMKYNDLDAFYEGSRLALARLYDPIATPAPHTFGIPHSSARSQNATVTVRNAPHKYPPIISREASPAHAQTRATKRQRPLLVVMSAEREVMGKIRALDAAATGMFAGETGGVFDVVQSPSFELSLEHESEYIKMFGAINSVVYRPTDVEPSAPLPVAAEHSANSSSAHALESRWSQEQQSKLSLGLRLALSRQLIAELTVYSRMADAFVVSGNSNLGRLALLLGGVEGAIGYGVKEDLLGDHSPMQLARRTIGGRIRSVDVPWFATSYRKGSYGDY
ncbi:hypothetical protein BKA62DRAFT_720962 [Auriculariales sp. MPI-PUGE-AT-0066]|nr:hypothetical protein BKA62DRAFT_720962 [Auriculariales sp. MPI-PUGE-AT-0066]